MKMNIAKKLYLAFGGVLAMLLVAGTLVLGLRMDLADRIGKGDRNTSNTAALSDAQSALWALRWGVAQYVAVTDPAVRAKITEDGPKLRKDLESALDRFDASQLSAEAKQSLQTLRANFERYVTGRARWLELMGAGQTEEAVKLRAEVTTPMGAATVKSFAELIELQRKVSAEDAQAASAALTRWGVLIAACLGLAVVAAIVVVAWTVRSITTPILDALRVAKAVAAGDLSIEVEARSHDETGQLLQAMAEMNRSLSRVVGRVRGNADSVATASAQIAQGNLDLSGRTEQQASSLQETAASMEQLGSTVRQNADNARQANQLAQGASHVALKGGEVVAQVVDTMKGINDSSRRIADIISVIDGIAFEVRSLAQRSAEAAREIKGLITDSVERVEAGSALVDQAGSTMDEVVAAIRRVTDIVGEISSASDEQSSGVAQVGTAVSQMDQATQQNAALVEESAAAAESLKSQAAQLVEAVSVFRLAQSNAPAGAPPDRATRPAAARPAPQASAQPSAAAGWASF